MKEHAIIKADDLITLVEAYNYLTAGIKTAPESNDLDQAHARLGLFLLKMDLI